MNLNKFDKLRVLVAVFMLVSISIILSYALTVENNKSHIQTFYPVEVSVEDLPHQMQEMIREGTTFSVVEVDGKLMYRVEEKGQNE